MRYNKELGLQKKLYPIFNSIEIMSDQFIRLAYMRAPKQTDTICKSENTKVNMTVEQLHAFLLKKLRNRYKLKIVTSEGGSGVYGGGNYIRMDINHVCNVRYKDKDYSWKEEQERFTVYKGKYGKFFYEDTAISTYIEIANFMYGGYKNAFGGPECSMYRSLNISILQYNGENTIVITENQSGLTQKVFWEFNDYNMKFVEYKDNHLVFANDYHKEEISIAFMSKNVDNVLKFLYLYMDKFFVKDHRILTKSWKQWRWAR